jgi:hypothetical protein
MLEDKERRIRENIAMNYGRIREVERELSGLQLQLHVNVGPKKQALEMMRRKIEEQNERVGEAQRRHTATAAAAKVAKEALEREEKVKQQLCEELDLLVQQSANSQMHKLEQLTQRLETLNSGLSQSQDHREGSSLSDGQRRQQSPNHSAGESAASVAAITASATPASLAATVAAHEKVSTPVVNGPAKGAHHVNVIADAVGPEVEAEACTAPRISASRADAEAAKARHVQIRSGSGGGRPAAPRQQQQASLLPRPPPPLAAAREPRESRDANGTFRGFE